MNDFIELVKDFFREKKVIAIIASILIFFTFAALIIALIQTSSEKTVATISVPDDFMSDSELLPPSGPKLLDDYYPFRTTKQSWSVEDAEVFFTVPSGSSLTNLEKANDKMVSDILEAAP